MNSRNKRYKRIHMKHYLLTLLFLGTFAALQAQSLFTGRVTNPKGHPLTVSISLQQTNRTLVKAYTATDNQGNYRLEYLGPEDSLLLVVSSLNVGRHERMVRNATQRQDFVLAENGIQLKEVSVRAPKITQRNDTLSYLVSAFADQSDRVIGDVLKKMPGIEVDESGNISYNGKAISHFYVEGMDLLQGRYGLATQNLPNKAVSVVQVLKNHQPVKVLKDKVISDEVAINLKLQEDAKGVFAATALAGGGYKPALWTAELVGMLFDKNYQTMSVYKGNNTGDDVRQEFRQKYGSYRAAATNGMLSVQMPSAPDVSSKRYFQNHSHAVSTNHLSKLKSGAEWSTGVMYYNDRIEREGRSVTGQYLSGGERLTVNENLASSNRVHNLEAASTLTINKEQHYLNNQLTIQANWDRDESLSAVTSNALTGNSAVNQRLERPLLAVGDNLFLIRSVGKSTYKLTASAGYSEMPHTLAVAPVDYWDELPVRSLEQDFTLRNAALNLGIEYGLKLGKFGLNYLLFGSGDLRRMDTGLGSRESGGDSFFADDIWKNRLRYDTWRGGLQQLYTYGNDPFSAELLLPLFYQRLRVNDRLAAERKNHDKPMIMPRLTIRYKLDNWALLLQGYYTYSYGDIYSVYKGYVMQGYRNLLRNSADDLPETREAGTRGSISYDDVFTSVFGNVQGGYTHRQRNLLYGYDYEGIMRIRRTLRQPTTWDSYDARFNLGKGFDFWAMTLQAKGSYQRDKSEGLIQGEVVDYVSDNIVCGFQANLQPVRWLSADYSLDGQWTRSYVKADRGNFSAVKSALQKLRLQFFPTRTLTLDAGLEHQYTNLASNRHMLFADFKATWRGKQVDIELEVCNLFNEKQYNRVFYNGPDMYRYSCQLRPVNAVLKIRYNFR